MVRTNLGEIKVEKTRGGKLRRLVRTLDYLCLPDTTLDLAPNHVPLSLPLGHALSHMHPSLTHIHTHLSLSLTHTLTDHSHTHTPYS